MWQDIGKRGKEILLLPFLLAVIDDIADNGKEMGVGMALPGGAEMLSPAGIGLAALGVAENQRGKIRNFSGGGGKFLPLGGDIILPNAVLISCGGRKIF